MEKTILIVLITTRNRNAVKVQEVLTENGCLIKTRLGVHDTYPEVCANYGLLILELVGDKKEQDKLAKKLGAISGVSVKINRIKAK
jgi:hypothetical protein